MKIDPLAIPTALRTSPVDSKHVDENAKAGAPLGKEAVDPEKLKLAREFEQIFLRKMLSSLEKGSKAAGASSGSSSSSDGYSSMVVNALADAVSQGGGVGLADMIARSATDQANRIAAARAHADAGSPTGGPAAPSSLPLPQGAPQPIAMPPVGATYRRPPPAQMFNENIDMHNLLKEPKP